MNKYYKNFYFTEINPEIERNRNKFLIDFQIDTNWEPDPSNNYLFLDKKQYNQEIHKDIYGRYICLFFPLFSKCDTSGWTKLSTVLQKGHDTWIKIVI